MGNGAKADLAIHKELRTYPKPLEELPAEASDDMSDMVSASDD